VPAPAPTGEAVRLLEGAERPVILAGGGAIAGSASLRTLAERLGAPVVMTTNARGVLPPDHPLAVPASPSLTAVRGLLGEADIVLAAGTEIGPTDFDMYDRGGPSLDGRLIRIEIDPAQMHSGLAADLPLLGDAAGTLAALARTTGPARAAAAGVARAARARVAAQEELSERERRSVSLLDTLRDTAPEALLIGDSTEAVYAGNLLFAAPRPRSWFNAATGYGALGYGLPAAIGATLGSGRPAVCIAGDGGLQFSLAELGTAVEERVPLVVLVWNNRGYGEIRRAMETAGVAPLGVDLHTPDFVALARAYGLASERVFNLPRLGERVRAALDRGGPTLIELPEAVALGV
jgi:acetolactate synthase-1/2/3 large subunit